MLTKQLNIYTKAKANLTLPHCLLHEESESAEGSGAELHSIQEREEEKEEERGRRGGLPWSRSKIQGGKA